MNWSHSRNLICLFDCQLFRYLEHLFKSEIFPCFFDGMKIVWVIHSNEYRCFNVEDMNIPQITERLSMSCIASFEEWSNIFLNRPFTLFKNDRDLRERYYSVTVSESISSSMTNLSYTGLPELVPDISPDFHTWEDHLSSMFPSE